MGDSSVRRLEIALDRTNGTYSPSELVSGKILAEFTRPKKIRGLRLVVIGEAVVKWSADSEKSDADGHYHKVVMTSREDYFSSKFFLIGSNSGPEIELPPGQLAYSFNIQLPSNLPSSFEHEYGYVRYTIKAVFDRPWKFDHEVKTAFTVLATYDLNRRPEASLSIREQVDKNFCCLCICPSGSLLAEICVPYSGYAPGQMIPVSIQISQNDSGVDIEKIKVQLRRALKFHATSPRWTDKEVEDIVSEEKCLNPFSNNDENHVFVQLRVPAQPPSSLEYCGIIDLNYVLRVVICFSGMHCSVERRFPILVGTVPLYNSYSNAQTAIITAAPSPSAPLLQPPSGAAVAMPYPGVVTPGNVSQAPSFGFVANAPSYPSHGSGDPYDLPPPSYEACMTGAKSIKDKDESEYVVGARTPFAPRYPVYDYGFTRNAMPSAPPDGQK